MSPCPIATAVNATALGQQLPTSAQAVAQVSTIQDPVAQTMTTLVDIRVGPTPCDILSHSMPYVTIVQMVESPFRRRRVKQLG